MVEFLDVRVPIDDAFLVAIEQLRENLKQDGYFRSTNEVIERELVKLHQTEGIRQSLKIDSGFPLIFETPANSTRLKVRIRNQVLMQEISKISDETNRPVTKIVYSLIRAFISNYSDLETALRQKNQA